MKKCTIVRTSLTLIAASILVVGGLSVISMALQQQQAYASGTQLCNICPRCQESLCHINGAQTGGPKDNGNVGHGNTGTANTGNGNVGSRNVGNGNTGRNDVGNGNTGSNIVGFGIKENGQR